MWKHRSASAYGNRVRVDGLLMRYFCTTPGTAWSQTGVQPVSITLDRSGKGKLVVPANGTSGEHAWSFRFKRDTFTGSVVGSHQDFEGHVCTATVNFRGKRSG